MTTRILCITAMLLAATAAHAQNTIDFSADVQQANGEATPTLTWSTTPPASSCEASGAWSGERGPEGQEQQPTITSSATYNIACTWPGDSIATLTWTIPEHNTDGSDYTDHRGVLISYALDDDPEECAGIADDRCVFVDDPERTMRTITGLTGVGTYNFVARACNERSVCSSPSNVAMKTFTGMVTVDESVGIVVNPVPGPITDLGVE